MKAIDRIDLHKIWYNIDTKCRVTSSSIVGGCNGHCWGCRRWNLKRMARILFDDRCVMGLRSTMIAQWKKDVIDVFDNLTAIEIINNYEYDKHTH